MCQIRSTAFWNSFRIEFFLPFSGMGRKRKRGQAHSTSNSSPKKHALEEDEEISFKIPSPAVKKAKLETESPPVPVPEPRVSPNGFILPDPLPLGFQLCDNVKTSWILGKSIGLGGFGEIYAARKKGERKENYVVKVVCKVVVTSWTRKWTKLCFQEPHENGPLFTEIAFYIKCGQKGKIDEWKQQRGLKHLGLAHFVASGSYVINSKKFRFLVLPRLGMDLQTLIDKSGGCFRPKSACSTAIQVINVLEYIHYHGYVHKDIKGSNLLMSRSSPTEVFLIDFGLCSRYIQHNLHRPYEPDRRWANEGTLEYVSRDSHIGCISR